MFQGLPLDVMQIFVREWTLVVICFYFKVWGILSLKCFMTGM